MKKTLGTLAWVTGICLAGAEGPIWINLVGLSVFLLSSISIGVTHHGRS